jgi:hypothetical protein
MTATARLSSEIPDRSEAYSPAGLAQPAGPGQRVVLNIPKGHRAFRMAVGQADPAGQQFGKVHSLAAAAVQLMNLSPAAEAVR